MHRHAYESLRRGASAATQIQPLHAYLPAPEDVPGPPPVEQAQPPSPGPDTQPLEIADDTSAWQRTLELLGITDAPPPDEEPLPPRGVKSPKPLGPPPQIEAVAEGLAGSNAPGATNPLMQRKAPLAELRQKRRRKLSKKPAAKQQGTQKQKRRKRRAPPPRKRASFRRSRKKTKAARRAALAHAGSPDAGDTVGLEAELALLPRRPGHQGPPVAGLADSEEDRSEVAAGDVPPAAPLPEEAAPEPPAAPQPPAVPAAGATLDPDFEQRLRSLGVPEAAFPQETRGQHSYTLRLPGPCVIETQLPIVIDGKRVRAGCFLIKRPVLSSGRTVPWLANGGVSTAWDLALARAGCTLVGRDG